MALAALVLLVTFAAQESAPKMKHHAAGTFEVKIVPQKPDNPPAESAKLGRMSIDKQFQGDITGSSVGEMLSVLNDKRDSGVYVAIERVTGTLQGRSGSFALHHTGLMNHGVPQLTISVVPDSGTGALAGITGTFTIKIEGGKHFYEFDYTLSADSPHPPPPAH